MARLTLDAARQATASIYASTSPSATRFGARAGGSMSSAPYYQDDLAWVHHVGYGQLAERSAPGILLLLERAGLSRGASVLDVGCGSGRLSGALADAGYCVRGVDASAAMVELARSHAPSSRSGACPPGRRPAHPAGCPRRMPS